MNVLPIRYGTGQSIAFKSRFSKRSAKAAIETDDIFKFKWLLISSLQYNVNQLRRSFTDNVNGLLKTRMNPGVEIIDFTRPDGSRKNLFITNIPGVLHEDDVVVNQLPLNLSPTFLKNDMFIVTVTMAL
jgi:hypothetical protein